MKSLVVDLLKFTAFLMLAGASLPALAAPNFYTNSTSGRWEVSSNWSLGAPSATDSSYITNLAPITPITVTLDATTSASFTNTMTVANLTIGSPTFSFANTLRIFSVAGPKAEPCGIRAPRAY